MRFPWSKPPLEQRASDYSSAAIEVLLNNATDTDQIPAGNTAVETACRGYWERAFAVADVKPETPATAALNGAVLASMAADLFDFGESLWSIDVAAGQVVLTQSCSWDVQGSAPYRYQADFAGPETTRRRFLSAGQVIHLRLGSGRGAPWSGRSPVGGQSANTSKLLAHIETRLGEEAGASVGNLLTTPAVDDSTANLQKDINRMKGRNLLVPSTSGAWGQGPAATAPRRDWLPARVGADPPESLVKLRREVCNDIASATGVPPALLVANTDGTHARESLRRLLHTTVQPLARMVEPELEEKLDAPGLRLSFDALSAADVTGKARGVMSLVKAGVPLEEALHSVGLLESQ